MIFNNLIDMIGQTPIIKLNKLVNNDMAEVYVKLERYNPGGSVKDRAALGMIEKAEKMGLLKSGDVIVEPTSGNTGIALAMIGRSKGYKVIIVMPDTMSVERRNIIKAYGAELVLTEGTKGMKGAIEMALDLAKNNDNYFVPQQFENIANSEKHYESTAEEILNDIPDLNTFVAGVGTGGTISGVGKKLKEKISNIEIIAVEPFNSPVLSGGSPSPHKIQGIGAGFIPKIYDGEIIDSIMTVKDENAFNTAKLMASEEGFLVGISSGANIYAALEVAKKLGPNYKVLTIAPDGGEKYFSMGLYD
ncbi:cysteine synthase A [Clostridium argentinense CDC 2741]|uniref:Cysteine synthase n=1 Tax=Clostridium argentinense CDC 2741 TaxID=1418104 RepID=A0A0C1TYP0_9CLOT|nr:cysteine synthase A [Clostridium argentinense]ARC84383.1 cysteine synthase A [Clostridium argentinense]KIE44428.1 cysteine synthase A [Clostridium argentinense CDC 2741]NFF38354.1 cysteine synthase A [Clostridium argentinense]NFP49062.1 cysteine synthase A [Clostridium argentinense]NFP71658.1 cysteine synthase A [Clostridium argentinense]